MSFKFMDSNRKNYEYDLIRTFATLCIVLFHFSSELMGKKVAPPVLPYMAGANLTIGQLGVSLFLILSGVLCSFSYERCQKACLQRADTETGIKPGATTEACSWCWSGTISFWKKRFLSIYPMYWIAWFSAWLMLWASAGRRLSPSFLFTLMGMDGYLGMSGRATWYLVGEWFTGMIVLLYLVMPFLYRGIHKYPKLAALAILVCGIACVEGYSGIRPKETDMLVRMVDFSIGLYLAGKREWSSRWLTGIAVIALSAVFLYGAEQYCRRQFADCLSRVLKQ